MLRALASHLQSCLEPHAQAVANSAFMFVLGRPAPSRSRQPVPPAASGRHEAERPKVADSKQPANEVVGVHASCSVTWPADSCLKHK